MELVGEAAADGAAVGLDGPELHAEAREDPLVGLEHPPVFPVGVGIVHVEGVAVLHDELTAAHQAEPGPDFVAELGLDLEEVDRQLLVALHDLAHDVGDDLLVRGTEAEVGALAILEAKQLAAVELPSAALLPQLGGLHGWHEQLLAAVALELFAHDVFELADAAKGQRQIVVDARRHFLNHAAAHHQLLADDIGIARRVAVGL